MADHSLPPPVGIRRIVTTHNKRGVATLQSDALLAMEDMPDIPGARSAAVWVTQDSIPTNENNFFDDGALRKISNPSNLDLVHPTGTNFRTTDLAPGGVTPMHRTSSMDYNILVLGEVILVLEDGTERHLKNPGDTVVQKGTMHAWRNPSQRWARWLSILIAAEPAEAGGGPLRPEFKFT